MNTKRKLVEKQETIDLALLLKYSEIDGTYEDLEAEYLVALQYDMEDTNFYWQEELSNIIQSIYEDNSFQI